MPELLAIENLRAGYGEAVVLSRVSLTIPEGQSLALLGRNGMGKTTLVNSVVGVTRYFAGSTGRTSRACALTSGRTRASAGCRRSATSSSRSPWRRTSRP
jgi:branched-chain amino acid transport system ATP-binding protein